MKATNLIAKLLSKFSEDDLDRISRLARDFQHRIDDGWFKNKRTGQWQKCRLESTAWDDPIMQESGCAGEFANDFRKKDLHDGCYFCTGEVAENGSEPDVMARWELI